MPTGDHRTVLNGGYPLIMGPKGEQGGLGKGQGQVNQSRVEGKGDSLWR